jgi:hypothetical protein
MYIRIHLKKNICHKIGGNGGKIWLCERKKGGVICFAQNMKWSSFKADRQDMERLKMTHNS